MVFKKAGWPWPLHTVCHEQASSRPIADRLKTVFQSGFDSLITQLFSDEYLLRKFDKAEMLELDDSTIPSDEHFDSRQHTRNIMIQLNRSILEGGDNNLWRRYFEFVVGYAAYLGVYALVITIPQRHLKELAGMFNQSAEKGLLGSLRLIIRVAFEASETGSYQWALYTQLRRLLNPKINVDTMLVLSADLPSEMELRRWVAEHIQYLTISPDCFTTNTKGHPVLASRHADILKQFLWRRATISIQSHTPGQDLVPYVKFVQFVFEKLREPSRNELESMKYSDILQEPLQPYCDNLESETYSVFEQDNAKYDEYEMALQRAFLTFPREHRITIFYIGSGRGQLIYSCMNASKKSDRSIFVYAIEKNPYPIQSLKRRIKKNKWHNHVQIVDSDVRDWQPSAQADVFLSELLGGFGDNELSPQCLSWAEKHLQKHTICIPRGYAAWCTPVSCSWLYRRMNQQEKSKYFVVSLNSIYRPSSVQKLWTFEHPSKQGDNFSRKGECKFTIEQPTTIHGFAGYFDCDLYEGCRLSTNPQDHTPDMYSWYPMLFAICDPIIVGKNSILVIRVWRKCEPKRVWYEWQLEALDDQGNTCFSTKIYNEQGQRLAIMM